jgi:hypothetical protein
VVLGLVYILPPSGLLFLLELTKKLKESQEQKKSIISGSSEL